MRHPYALRSGVLAGVAALVLVSACAKSDPGSPLQASDLVVLQGATFDPNEIMTPDVFQDSTTFDATAIQNFLERTPYKQSSFLATYQSNGVRASDGIFRAAQTSHINPFVIMVRAQVLQGLIGTQFYPFPPDRVEYVFRCGCTNGSSCDPSLAGFDRQADCLARNLRTAFDQISATGVSAGGWGKGKTSTTLDNVKVTPADASTAALYQFNPTVGKGQSDEWLFWNIWQNYSAFLQYSAPPGGGNQGAWIGDACTASSQCIAPGATCATNFPNGMCVAPCTDSCPSDPAHPASFCADFGDQGGYCLPKCDSGVPGSCRTGYDCRAIYQFGSNQTKSANVCVKSQSG